MKNKSPEIIYADDHIVIANKPADLLSVPGRGPENQDCLVSRLQTTYPTIRIVHRLDCATSGVMVLALNPDALRHLSRQFHDRLTEKRYIADIAGSLDITEGEVNLPLRCDWENRPKQIVDFEQGKKAKTCWQKLQSFESHTRVALTPITGRSHQLRVHMQQIGHPILGDRFYAPTNVVKMSPRLHLHAEQLGLFHPVTEEKMSFCCPCPF